MPDTDRERPKIGHDKPFFLAPGQDCDCFHCHNFKENVRSMLSDTDPLERDPLDRLKEAVAGMSLGYPADIYRTAIAAWEKERAEAINQGDVLHLLRAEVLKVAEGMDTWVAGYVNSTSFKVAAAWLRKACE